MGKGVIVFVLLFAVFTGYYFFRGLLSQEEVFGAEAPAEARAARIGEILADPGAYSGQMLVVEGKISLVCGSGCWFYMVSAGEREGIVVDLAPAGLTVPRRINARVRVYGGVLVDGNRVLLEGLRVEFL
ncbi:MAG: hypothetical protein AB1576_06240 [Bacillota bacterium]|jgi:hypothetical protein